MDAQPEFCPFDPDGELRVYVRNLPHWRKPGATYFVTFSQDDAIPAGVLKAWQDERSRWYKAHGLDPQWKRSDPERFNAAFGKLAEGVRRAFEKQQARRLHGELDRCRGSCVLRHGRPLTILRDAMYFFHARRLWMGDFVIMPNHVHALVLPMISSLGLRPEKIDAPGSESKATTGNELEDLLGSIKKWSARNIGKWLDGQPQEFQPRGPAHNRPRFW